jgi:hypothetical protein
MTIRAIVFGLVVALLGATSLAAQSQLGKDMKLEDAGFKMRESQHAAEDGAAQFDSALQVRATPQERGALLRLCRSRLPLRLCR